MTTEKPLTDQEKTEALLNELGIGHEARQGSIYIEESMAKVSGYSQFWVEFDFDSDGKFREVVIGE